MEALKFRKIISKAEKITFLTSIKSVYAGNAIGVLTPNKIGTFIGRALYLKNKNTITVISSTILGNLSQLCTTALFGFMGFLIVVINGSNLSFYTEEFPLIALMFSTVLFIGLGVLLFSPSFLLRITAKIPIIKKYNQQLQFLQTIENRELVTVLSYSIFRYIVFALQFYMLLVLFNVEMNLSSVFTFICVLYLIVTFIPSPFMGNLFTREAVVLLLLANYNSPTEVLTASFILWVINIAFPAILGSLLFLFNKEAKENGTE